MECVRINAHDGAIFFVELLNLEDVLSVSRIYIVVKFIPGVC